MALSIRDAGAGFLAGLTAIPTALATALLVFGSLGAAFVDSSAAAAIYSLVIGGAIVAMLASSSPMIPVPLIGPNLVLAGLVATIAGTYSGSPDLPLLVAGGVGLCGMIAGLLQLFLGTSGLAAAGSFVPYPVVVGLLNGIAVITVISQLRPLFEDAAGLHVIPTHPAALVFVMLLVALIVFFPSISRVLGRLKVVPGPLAALAVATVAYQAAKWLWPSLDLGSTLGRLSIPFIPNFSIAALFTSDLASRLQPLYLEIGGSALAAIGVATIETLVTMRLAQNAIDTSFSSRRQIGAFGVANAAVASAGGLILSGQPSLTMMAISVGGRTRVTTFVMALTVLVLGVAYSNVLAVIPVAILSAILIATGFRMIDVWTFRLFPALVGLRSPELRKRAVSDLLVVTCVMAITVFYSVIGGIAVGCVLSCAIFIMRMSQPVVHHTLSGADARSKQVRNSMEEATLAAVLPRIVLKLQGVLFFGNANELADKMRVLQEKYDIIILDCGRITDIDVSGANSLRAILDRAVRQHKQVRFCNVPDALVDAFVDALSVAKNDLVRELDFTLAQVENELLRPADDQNPHAALAFDQIDVLRGLSPDEVALLDPIMPLRLFGPGEVICREGEAGDRMWLILRGNVSVTVSAGERVRRLASFGAGTTVGEMALIEPSARLADVVADDDVECREFTHDRFAEIQRDHPALAAKLLGNLARALFLRLRITNTDLRLLLDEF